MTYFEQSGLPENNSGLPNTSKHNASGPPHLDERKPNASLRKGGRDLAGAQNTLKDKRREFQAATPALPDRLSVPPGSQLGHFLKQAKNHSARKTLIVKRKGEEGFSPADAHAVSAKDGSQKNSPAVPQSTKPVEDSTQGAEKKPAPGATRPLSYVPRLRDYQPDELLTPEEASSVLKLAEKTLANKRSDGTGPKFIRICGRIRYRYADLQAFIESGRRGSTSEQGGDNA